VSLLTASNARLLLVAYPRRVAVSETTELKFVLEGATIIRIHGTHSVRSSGSDVTADIRSLLAVINSESLPKFNIEVVIIDR